MHFTIQPLPDEFPQNSENIEKGREYHQLGIGTVEMLVHIPHDFSMLVF